MKRENNILITGASGFIGGFFVSEALKRKFNVFVLVRKSTNLEQLAQLPVTVIEVDFGDSVDFANKLALLPLLTYVVHNAGITRTVNSDDFFMVNSRYTQNLLKALKEADRIPLKFLYVSSLAAIGPNSTNMPIRFDKVPCPLTQYGKSKLEAEKCIVKSAVPYLIFRPTAVYGPGDKDFFQTVQINNKGIDLGIGLKAQQLTFIYVKDFARLVFDALESAFVNKIYLASDGSIYKKTDFGSLVSKELGKKVRVINVPISLAKIVAGVSNFISRITTKPSILRIDKIAELSAGNWKCDITPIITDLNFSASYKLDRGLNETITWYKEMNWLK